MDAEKIGSLICRLRKEHGLTQRALAQRLNISDKTVSKWERGVGCPDAAMLPLLSRLFAVDLEGLFKGELNAAEQRGGNMKKICFMVCPQCGNLITSLSPEANVSCCGRRLAPLPMQKAPENERLTVEAVEDELYITSAHPMEREHYITFAALLTWDGVTVKKLYPEWGLQVRFPAGRRGRLLWHCSRHGLFYQDI